MKLQKAFVCDVIPKPVPALTDVPGCVRQETATLADAAITELIFNCWVFVGVVGCSIKSSVAGIVLFAAIVLFS